MWPPSWYIISIANGKCTEPAYGFIPHSKTHQTLTSSRLSKALPLANLSGYSLLAGLQKSELSFPPKSDSLETESKKKK